MAMIQSEWFWIKKDPDAPTISNAAGFGRQKYPYFTDEKSFAQVDDDVAYYSYGGQIVECDFLFEPTFLIHDGLQSLFKFLEPDLKFKGIQLYSEHEPEEFAKPLYWLPYLPVTDAIHEKTQVVQGKPVNLSLKAESFGDKRILHCKLPAADIWLLSLEASECLLRRQPIGITLEKVFSQG